MSKSKIGCDAKGPHYDEEKVGHDLRKSLYSDAKSQLRDALLLKLGFPKAFFGNSTISRRTKVEIHSLVVL